MFLFSYIYYKISREYIQQSYKTVGAFLEDLAL